MIMTSPSTTMATTLAFNFHAVALLEKGMYREADLLLVRALTQLTDEAALEQAEVSCRSSLMTTVGVARRERGQLQSSASLLHVVPICILDHHILMVEQSFAPNNAFAFYNKSFLVAANLEYSYSASAQKQLAAVLWYNWGVSCHCSAISNGSCDGLRKALDLYNKSFKILIPELGTICRMCSDSNADDNEDSSSSMILLLLAVCNNMGYCACYFADKVMARGFHEYIQAILSSSRCHTVIDFSGLFYTTALLDSKMIMSLSPAA
jgi:hypothetical protein